MLSKNCNQLEIKNIENELKECNYEPTMKNYYINMISQIMNFPQTKKAMCLKENINQENVIVIHIFMKIPLYNNIYSVPLKIYIAKNVPLVPPKITLDIEKGNGINEYYLNKKIISNSGVIMIQSLENWNRSTNIEDIMKEIYGLFCDHFPMFSYNPKKSKSSSLNINELNNISDNQINNIDFKNQEELKRINEEIKMKNKIINKQQVEIIKYQNKIKELEHNLENSKQLNDTLLNKIKEDKNNKGAQQKNVNEKSFAVIFISIDQKIHYPVICYNDDLVSRLEEEVYSEYTEYKEYNTFLTVNGKTIKRFKTVQENGIKKGDIILITIYEG